MSGKDIADLIEELIAWLSNRENMPENMHISFDESLISEGLLFCFFKTTKYLNVEILGDKSRLLNGLNEAGLVAAPLRQGQGVVNLVDKIYSLT